MITEDIACQMAVAAPRQAPQAAPVLQATIGCQIRGAGVCQMAEGEALPPTHHQALQVLHPRLLHPLNPHQQLLHPLNLHQQLLHDQCKEKEEGSITDMCSFPFSTRLSTRQYTFSKNPKNKTRHLLRRRGVRPRIYSHPPR